MLFTKEDHPSESPIRDVKDLLRRRMGRGQIIFEVVPGEKIEFGPTVSARKKTVRLLQGDRGPTLRAWMFDFPI